MSGTEAQSLLPKDVESGTAGKIRLYGKNDPFVYCMFIFQVASLVLFAYFTEYAPIINDVTAKQVPAMNDTFLYYLGIVIMMLVGFGYLMTFLKNSGLAAVGFTFIITMMAVQADILFEGLFKCAYSNEWKVIEIDLSSFINGNFAAATCLISFGALIGKVGMNVLCPLMLFEVGFYALNKQVVAAHFNMADIGGTVEIHMFGAYFGLAAAAVAGTDTEDADESSSRTSDITSLIGTVFLWIFWPTFNGAGAPMGSPMQLLIIINTVLALTASCAWTFVMSKMFFSHKFSTVDIQNATLSGGVMVGVVSNYLLHPAGAIGIGMIAATVCVVGYNVIQPRLTNSFVHDTCGINNLHGMPAICGALASIILCASIDTKHMDVAYSHVERMSAFPMGGEQWKAQLLGSLATFAIAVVSGAISMWLCKVFRDPYSHKFLDEAHFQVDYKDV